MYDSAKLFRDLHPRSVGLAVWVGTSPLGLGVLADRRSDFEQRVRDSYGATHFQGRSPWRPIRHANR